MVTLQADDSHTMTALGDGTTVLFGGWDGGYLNDVYTLTVSVTSATWASLSSDGDTPSGRGSHTMTALGDGTTVLFGGHGGAFLNDVYTLTLAHVVAHGVAHTVAHGVAHSVPDTTAMASPTASPTSSWITMVRRPWSVAHAVPPSAHGVAHAVPDTIAGVAHGGRPRVPDTSTASPSPTQSPIQGDRPLASPTIAHGDTIAHGVAHVAPSRPLPSHPHRQRHGDDTQIPEWSRPRRRPLASPTHRQLSAHGVDTGSISSPQTPSRPLGRRHHAVAHGIAHGVAHTVAHAVADTIAHGVAHGFAHVVAHSVAHAVPTPSPTASPTASASPDTIAHGVAHPSTPSPTASPTASPTPSPTASPTPSPTASPTAFPTASPTPIRTTSATPSPTPWPACVDGELDSSWISDGAVSDGEWTCDAYSALGDLCAYEEIEQKCCYCRGGGRSLQASTDSTTCVDDALPGSWNSGGAFTCDTYYRLYGSFFCFYGAIKESCCHCGGGTAVQASTTSAPCVDDTLNSEWSSGGGLTCAVLAGLDNTAHCDKDEIAQTCCHCAASGDQVATYVIAGEPVDEQLGGREGRGVQGGQSWHRRRCVSELCVGPSQRWR